MTISSRKRRAGLSPRSSLRPRRRSRYSSEARQKNPPNPSTISASSTSTRPCVGAITCSSLQDLLRDDEIHDLARSLVDLGDLGVAVMALRGEIREVAVPAEDLDAFAPV